MARVALGKGLGALIGTKELADPKPNTDAGERVQELSVSSIIPSPLQPRKTFHPAKMEELVSSIRAHGIQQPLIARPNGKRFELVAGERRWRAAQTVGLKTVPVIVRKAEDQTVLELALIENLQRADLNPIEEAEGYGLLMEKFDLTQEQIANQVGKSRASVANALRLRGLVSDVKDMVAQAQISVGHAKVILGLETEDEQIAIAREVIKRSLSVRETEKLIRSFGHTSNNDSAKNKKSKTSGHDWRDLELRIQRSTGTKARLVGTADKGHLEIQYFSGSDLDRILALLSVKTD